MRRVVLTLIIICLLLHFYPVKAFYKNSGEIKVYSISIITPDINNPALVSPQVAPELAGITISYLKDYINIVNNQGILNLSESSAFKKYKNPTTQNYLKYILVSSITYEESVKPGLKVPWGTTAYRPDYNYYLSRENICQLVDKQNIKEIWVWTHHNIDIEPAESNMSMGNQIKEYWNYPNYGDVSNSERSNDLPVCENTYVLYNYNFTRGIGELMEDHTHHLEAIFNFLNYNLFWVKFGGMNINSALPNNPGCGWTHYPPNGEKDYDWFNTGLKTSDCEDWKPDRTGVKETFNCTKWSKQATCPEDGGVAFKTWWMQSLPGYNNGLVDNGKELRNWWEAKENFDKVIQQETKLHKWKYGDFNKDGINSILDSTSFMQSFFSDIPKIFMDLDDDNTVGLNDLILQLTYKNQ